jgi:hypothetical protein
VSWTPPFRIHKYLFMMEVDGLGCRSLEGTAYLDGNLLELTMIYLQAASCNGHLWLHKLLWRVSRRIHKIACCLPLQHQLDWLNTTFLFACNGPACWKTSGHGVLSAHAFRGVRSFGFLVSHFILPCTSKSHLHVSSACSWYRSLIPTNFTKSTWLKDCAWESARVCFTFPR